jgi:hypothetical protein
VLEGEREERSDFSDRSANLSDQSDVEFVFSFNIEDDMKADVRMNGEALRPRHPEDVVVVLQLLHGDGYSVASL